MTKLLLNIFIKNNSEVENTSVREAYGILGGIVGIICNIALFVIKIVLGFITKSVAITTDAFNNLSDVGSSLVTLIAAKAGNKPADEEHPFGHGRIEYIAGLIVSFMILFFGVQFFISSVTKIFKPEAIEPNTVAYILLIFTVLLKLWLGLFNKKLGGSINSSALIATAQDSFNDCLATSATIISLLVYTFFDINIDGYAGCIIAVFVILSGLNIAKETLAPLIGEPVNYELAQAIKNKLLSYENIKGCHDLIVHNYGPNKSMATIHAEVPDNIGIRRLHDIVDLAEREISEQLGILLVIHMDPIAVDDEQTLLLDNLTNRIITSIDQNVTKHDFRIVSGETNVKMIFDIVIPFSYSTERQKSIVESIERQVKKENENYSCVIVVDRSYIDTRKR